METKMTPTQRFEFRKRVREAVRARVRGGGTGAMEQAAQDFYVDLYTVRRWTARLSLPTLNIAMRIAPSLGIKVEA